MILRKEGEWESKHQHDINGHHRDLFVWPFVLGECQGNCGRGLLGFFNRRCRSGLDCAIDNQATLAAAGYDLQFAYCDIPNFRRRRYFCYDPTKLVSPSVGPSAKSTTQPSTKPSSRPSRKPSINFKPSAKPSSKPSSQPTSTPKKCFTTNTELKTAVASYNATNITELYGNISDWCVGFVTDFSDIFSFQMSFNEDISKWDTSNATTMSAMFDFAKSFNHDISQWNVSKVTDMSFMFFYASSFNNNISKWDVSNVTSMSNMFDHASSFNQDISSWDISKVTFMFEMFTSATLFNQNLCSWNTKCQSFVRPLTLFSGT